ncbi:MAG: flagellar basal body rod protein FlgB [Deltaproteobacteria bacterium]|nr:flagellar basal body rod protein FlgB [Deltaproteobacteria bacterium]
MADLFGNEFQVLARSLDFCAERNNLITANLANADTPGYKAVRIDFEKTLQGMLKKQGGEELRRTDPKHFSMDPAATVAGPKITIREDSLKQDGNSVNMDEEVARMSMNQIRYNAGVEVLNNLFKNLEYAIQEGGQ